MSLLPIITLPNKNLYNVAEEIQVFDEQLSTLADDMLETMYAAPGIGLAATQIDQHIQLVVLDVSENNDRPLIMVNPHIVGHQGEQVYEEGCLSIPGIYAKVKRAERIQATYQDVSGKQQEIEADGLLSVCIQHEIDHLKGVLFLDHLSMLKRKLAMKKYNKNQLAAG